MKTKTTIQKLKEFQTETGIAWGIISTAIGVSKFTLSRWVNGKHKPMKVYEKMILKFLNKNS